MKSNSYIIEKLDNLGNGITYIDGKVTFVPKTIIGDEVELKIIKEKKKYNIAEVSKYLSRGDKYISAFCEHFDTCGACDFQNISYKEELMHKEAIISHEFGRATTKPILYSEDKFYRNKAVFHYDRKLDQFGFFKKGSNEVVNINNCLVISPLILNTLKRVNKYLKKRNENLHTLTIRTTNTKELMISIYGNLKIDSFLKEFNDINSVYLNDELIYGNKYIKDQLMGKTFLIANDSFYQINLFNTEKLYAKVIDYVKDNAYERALDLYCGTGTISILISNYLKSVVGIDNNKEAIACAKENKRINKATNVSFILGDASKEGEDILTADLIIVDPPRNGLDKLGKENLLRFKAKTIIYVSCNYSTLKRDIEDLSSHYQLKEISPVDMFAHTYHVECVCAMKLR